MTAVNVFLPVDVWGNFLIKNLEFQKHDTEPKLRGVVVGTPSVCPLTEVPDVIPSLERLVLCL
jgi:hypothetical protein